MELVCCATVLARLAPLMKCVWNVILETIFSITVVSTVLIIACTARMASPVTPAIKDFIWRMQLVVASTVQQ